MLNNFVATVGHDYMTAEHRAKALENARELSIRVDVNEVPAGDVDMTLGEAMNAFDKSSEIMQGRGYAMQDMAILRRLPRWDNFMRWKNQVMVGLMLISEVPSYDKEANNRLKSIIDNCDTLYN